MGILLRFLQQPCLPARLIAGEPRPMVVHEAQTIVAQKFAVQLAEGIYCLSLIGWQQDRPFHLRFLHQAHKPTIVEERCQMLPGVGPGVGYFDQWRVASGEWRVEMFAHRLSPIALRPLLYQFLVSHHLRPAFGLIVAALQPGVLAGKGLFRQSLAQAQKLLELVDGRLILFLVSVNFGQGLFDDGFINLAGEIVEEGIGPFPHGNLLVQADQPQSYR
jgi:hypothetical protein